MSGEIKFYLLTYLSFDNMVFGCFKENGHFCKHCHINRSLKNICFRDYFAHKFNA